MVAVFTVVRNNKAKLCEAGNLVDELILVNERPYEVLTVKLYHAGKFETEFETPLTHPCRT